jgi:SAM-dependent methyltransferase
MPRKEKIQQMFDDIAPSYDRLNHLMSLDVDKWWRRRALKEIVDGTPQQILDVACGTGDSTIAIAQAAGSGSRVTGVDISEGMMALVMRKAAHEGVHDRIRLQVADGENLPFAEGSFHRVFCAFGIRKGGDSGTFSAGEPSFTRALQRLFPTYSSLDRRAGVREQGRLSLPAGFRPGVPVAGALLHHDVGGRFHAGAAPFTEPGPVPYVCWGKMIIFVNFDKYLNL